MLSELVFIKYEICLSSFDESEHTELTTVSDNVQTN